MMRPKYWISVTATLLLALTTLSLAVHAGFREAYAQQDNAAPAGAIPADPLAVPEMPRVSPSMANVFGESYWYLPYAITSTEQGLAFVDGYRKLMKEGGELPAKLNVGEGKGACRRDTLPRLQGDIQQFFICDINNPAASAISTTEIPVVITQPAPGDPGATVLFLDGHVEFVKYGTFPLERDFIEALMELDPPEYSNEDRDRQESR